MLCNTRKKDVRRFGVVKGVNVIVGQNGNFLVYLFSQFFFVILEKNLELIK